MRAYRRGGARARPPPPGAVCDLRRPGTSALCGLRCVADAAPATRLRALWLAGPMAGPALRRVRGEEARLRVCTLGGRVRRRGAGTRSGVEGAGQTTPRAGGGRDRGRGRPACLGRCPGPRPRGPGARVGAGGCAGAGARVRARASLGAARGRRAGSHARPPAPTRALARGAAAERAGKRRRSRHCPRGGLRGRRRVHVGRDRRRLREGVSCCWCSHRSGRDFRASRSLDWD